MIEQADPQRRRPLWRCLLRYAGWVCAGLSGLLLVVLITLVAINWQDEELTPEAKAWLTKPPNLVADADNAWLAMIAVGIEKQPGTVIGREMLESLAQKPRLLGAEDESLKEFGPVWQSGDFDAAICNIRQNGPDILLRILARQAELQMLVDKQRAILNRYFMAVSLPGVHEETPDKPEAMLPSGQFTKAACLARIDLTLRLLSGDKQAGIQFAEHARYWLNALGKAQNLLSAMITNAQIQADLAVLTGLREKEPKAVKSLQPRLRSDFQAFSRWEESALRQHVMAGEFRFTSTVLQDLNRARSHQADGVLASLSTGVYRWTYQPQASMNLSFKVLSGEATKDLCDIYHWSLAYNPVGKILACVAAPSYESYFTRIRQTQSEAAKLFPLPVSLR